MTELPRIVSPTRWKCRLYLPSDSFLAQVAELGVADRPGRAAVVHRMAAGRVRVGRLDDDIAAQVRDLAAGVTASHMLVLERSIRVSDWSRIAVTNRSSVNALRPLAPGLKVPLFRPLLSIAVAVMMTRSPTRHPVTVSARRTIVSPFLAVSPSFTQVRFILAPWNSMRPPQHTIAGHVFESISGIETSRILAVQSAR